MIVALNLIIRDGECNALRLLCRFADYSLHYVSGFQFGAM